MQKVEKREENCTLRLRIFRCACNHRLRFGTQTCSYRFRPTPIRNRWWFPLLLAGLAGLAAWKYLLV